VGGRLARLEAAAQVDGDVDDPAARAHRGDHVAGDQLGCLGAGHEDRADHDVGFRGGAEARVEVLDGIARQAEAARAGVATGSETLA
jgi:hypothetical protein